MRHRALPFAMIAAVCGLLTSATPGWAVPATYVSGTGTDSGNCTVAAPCRTFQFAHDKTDAKGVISVLSPGSFGPVTITKSISIVARGVTALIQTATSSCGGAAVCISASATDIVRLSGLTIDLNAAPKDGIAFDSGAALHVQHSVIRRVNAAGISVDLAGAGEFYVSDCTITNANLGVDVRTSGSDRVTGVINRVHIEGPTQIGIQFQGSGEIVATIRDSVISGAVNGIEALDASTGMIDRTVIVNGSTGVFAAGSAVTVRIGDSTVTGNTTGLIATAGGIIASYQTNKVIGNGNDSTAQLGVGRRR
jgi:hypothetical protein